VVAAGSLESPRDQGGLVAGGEEDSSLPTGFGAPTPPQRRTGWYGWTEGRFRCDRAHELRRRPVVACRTTLHQWRALVVIGRAGTIRVGEVGLQIGTALSATSRLLSRLERRGYLTSARDEKDRRATNVQLTPLGEQVRVAVIDRRRQLMQEALSHRQGPLPKDLARGLHALGKAFAPYT